jgi:hypothetical protein
VRHQALCHTQLCLPATGPPNEPDETLLGASRHALVSAIGQRDCGSSFGGCPGIVAGDIHAQWDQQIGCTSHGFLNHLCSRRFFLRRRLEDRLVVHMEHQPSGQPLNPEPRVEPAGLFEVPAARCDQVVIANITSCHPQRSPQALQDVRGREPPFRHAIHSIRVEGVTLAAARHRLALVHPCRSNMNVI